MTTLTRRTEETTDTLVNDFGVTDRLNRRMGLTVKVQTLTFTAQEAGATYGWQMEPGVWFSYETQTTRNGNSHQASHSGKKFATAAERDAAVAKAIKQARARAEAPAARLKA